MSSRRTNIFAACCHFDISLYLLSTSFRWNPFFYNFLFRETVKRRNMPVGNFVKNNLNLLIFAYSTVPRLILICCRQFSRYIKVYFCAEIMLFLSKIAVPIVFVALSFTHMAMAATKVRHITSHRRKLFLLRIVCNIDIVLQINNKFSMQ